MIAPEMTCLHCGGYVHPPSQGTAVYVRGHGDPPTPTADRPRTWIRIGDLCPRCVQLQKDEKDGVQRVEDPPEAYLVKSTPEKRRATPKKPSRRRQGVASKGLAMRYRAIRRSKRSKTPR